MEVAVRLACLVGLGGLTTVTSWLLLFFFEVCLLQQNRLAGPSTEVGGRDFRRPRPAFRLVLWEGNVPKDRMIAYASVRSGYGSSHSRTYKRRLPLIML